ncbi:porin PorA family protein [Nocardia sp. SYP-A9097]|uniref:porin PorA family protein n=1 Tax=Nocardia sp. SYP-A9097 TaxID=2663237 RepID=UPI0018913423|nr:porin PorA family protein [Nocardia sp. SYP-A9097]
MRRSSVILLAVGIVLIVLGAVARFAVTPAVSKLPADTDIAIKYSGTAHTLLNAQALQQGQADKVFAKEVPITIDRTVTVLENHGNTAVVKDTSTMVAGQTKLPTARTFAVDRKTMEATAPPEGVTVEPASGIAIGFPIGADQDDHYTLWIPNLQAAVPVKFARTDTRHGRDVNVYTAAATGEVKDKETLASFPATLPKTTAAALLAALPAETAAKFGAASAALPDPIPLTYLFETTVETYADQRTGVTIDQHLVRTITAAVRAGDKTMPLTQVLSVEADITDDSQRAQADKAADSAKKLTLVSVVVPVILAVLGAILLVLAVIRRRPAVQEP